MSINWSTFLLEILNFLVLVWILKHFLYRPVLAVIARRRAAVEKTLADAAAREGAAQDLEKRYQGRLDEWAKEKEAARAQLTAELDAERGRQRAGLQASLEAERSNHAAAAARAAAQERERMEREAARNGARFAALLLHDVAGADTGARLLERLLRDLAALPPERAATLRADMVRGGAPAQVRSAQPLDDATRGRVAAALATLTGVSTPPAFATDPALLAGLRIEAGTWRLGANLADELAAFAELDHGG
ncbi:MAG TPA: F0F1 ATP synthase subunit delta [Steroidobacteraceae bacterium]|nr:F0F1 ATP synthase subunit delta [Steroidobacteraceae bacterium]